MKNSICFLIIAFSASLTACSTSKKIDEDIKMKSVEITKDSTIVCFGDSLTYGHGADSATESWPSLLQRKVNIPVVNSGKNDDTTTDGLNRFKADVLDKNPAVLIIDFGGNDVFYPSKHNSYKQIESNFREMLEQIDFTKTQVYIMRFYNDQMRFLDFFGNFDRILKRLQKDYDVQIIWDAWKDVWGHKDLKFDMSHANAKGYAVMVENIFEEIKPSLEANNLLKE